jgi:hypothetical protein
MKRLIPGSLLIFFRENSDADALFYYLYCLEMFSKRTVHVIGSRDSSVGTGWTTEGSEFESR